MPKKAIKKKTKTAKPAKPAKPTLVWKRTKRGRPKKTPSVVGRRSSVKTRKTSATVVPSFSSGKNKPDLKVGTTTIEQVIEQSKFQLGPKENSGEFQAHNLPFEYGHNRIVLLVVDPKFAFVYWEVKNEKLHEAADSIGRNAKLTLRFRNLDTRHFWDISIYERVGNWYLKLDHPEQNLSVEIGMKNDRGDFYSIASSNTMRLPRTGLAKRGPIKWMLVSPTGEKVATEVEEYTDADLELLKKILGPYFYDLLRQGKFANIAGSSAENVFMNISSF